jgi:competence ComEA-like helix-hairpin-helix protein
VPVPLDLIKPQLATGHVSLPLATAIEALPASLFTRPLPAIEGKVIPLSVQEIVSQLPADYFADQLQHVRQEVVELDEAGIPAPFQERQAAPPPQPAPEPAPTPVKPEPVAPEMAVAPAALEDENFALFSEKPPESPAPAEAPAQTPPTPDTGFLVDLNRCTEAELLKLHGVGPSLARRIVDYRNQHGRFQSLEELRQVPGMGRKTFRAVTGPDPKKLNRLLRIEHDRELSLQEIVSALAGLRGVEGCILAMDDGLLLTGQLPLPLEPNAVGALAPQLFKKVERYTRELEVGRVRRLTIFTEQKPMSIFQAGNIYLVVVHHARNYSKALLRRCERISQELARMCRKRAVV